MRQRPPKSSLEDGFDDVPEGAFRHIGGVHVDQWHNDSLTGSSGDFWQESSGEESSGVLRVGCGVVGCSASPTRPFSSRASPSSAALPISIRDFS